MVLALPGTPADTNQWRKPPAPVKERVRRGNTGVTNSRATLQLAERA
jgi:hypothetical protein